MLAHVSCLSVAAIAAERSMRAGIANPFRLAEKHRVAAGRRSLPLSGACGMIDTPEIEAVLKAVRWQGEVL